MEYSKNIRLRNARKKVEVLKGFYIHFSVYLVVNIVLFIVRGNVLEFFGNTSPDKNFIEWVGWNILAVPVFWGIGLLFHAVKTFQIQFEFMKDWEERQLKKFIEEEESQMEKY